MGVIRIHTGIENRMDEITQGEDQGWKLGNNYLRGIWRNKKEVKETKKSDPRSKRRIRDELFHN